MIKEKFYDSIRSNLFGGRLNQGHVDNINILIAEYRKYIGLDYRHLAYVLATVFHETASTMQPIREIGLGYGHEYGQKLKYGNGVGKRISYFTPNHIYYGRGHVQNTWFEVYERLTKHNKYGWDFLNNPDLLLQMQPSAWATLYGMVNGIYTGKKLVNYINDETTDFVGARRIINIQDKAQLIAGYAHKFYNALIQI